MSDIWGQVSMNHNNYLCEIEFVLELLMDTFDTKNNLIKYFLSSRARYKV